LHRIIFAAARCRFRSKRLSCVVHEARDSHCPISYPTGGRPARLVSLDTLLHFVSRYWAVVPRTLYRIGLSHRPVGHASNQEAHGLRDHSRSEPDRCLSSRASLFRVVVRVSPALLLHDRRVRRRLMKLHSCGRRQCVTIQPRRCDGPPGGTQGGAARKAILLTREASRPKCPIRQRGSFDKAGDRSAGLRDGCDRGCVDFATWGTPGYLERSWNIRVPLMPHLSRPVSRWAPRE
jgi:hypothetical protein